MKKKPWGGRFAEGTARIVEEFTASLRFDRRLWRQDIRGSIAHARMLGRCGIISRAEADKIVSGLEEIAREIERGDFPFDPALEDIHMNIERRLIDKIGDAGGKLHTGRSRNDEVALDLRLYLRDEIAAIGEALRGLEKALVAQAQRHLGTILPGYTHLQRAQPVLLAHHLLAYVEMAERDRARLRDCLVRLNVMPLGSGALAGVSYPIDRRYVARLLRFPAISENSLDAVSDRDFVVEFLACAALIMVHLSRLAEEVILWATAEFGFVEIPDAFATGSSMMPQKRNPDVAELVRGKAGRVAGSLVALLATLKGLPLSYNRDLQEDKEALFDAVDTVKASLGAMAALLGQLRFRPERMRAAAAEGYLNATDLADYLVGRGVAFRQAHAIVGRIVRDCADAGRGLEDLSLSEFRRYSRRFDRDVHRFISLDACVARRRGPGGTAPRSVAAALTRAKARLRR